MSLTKYLLIEGKKDVIIEKIGLPPHLAEYCVEFYDKKFVLYWASTIKDALSHGIGSGVLDPDYTYTQFVNNMKFLELKRLERNIKDPKTPRLPKNIMNQFKQKRDTPWVHFERAENYNNMYTTIRDYAEATNQNFQNDSFNEKVREAIRWHQQREEGGSSKALQLKEGQEMIKEFSDGYYWVDLGTNKCGEEADSMGHCGYTGADTLLSLRDPEGVPHVTASVNYLGTVNIQLTQMKGNGNTKPVEKYHPYIVDFIINGENYESHNIRSTTQHYQITDYQPEYSPEDDFNLFDLDKRLFNKIKENDDEFATTLFGWSKHYFQKLNKDLPEELVEYMKDDRQYLLKLKEEGYLELPQSSSYGESYWFLEFDDNKSEFILNLKKPFNAFLKYAVPPTSNLFQKVQGNDKEAVQKVFKMLFKISSSKINMKDFDAHEEVKITLPDDLAIDWILFRNSMSEESPIKPLS